MKRGIDCQFCASLIYWYILYFFLSCNSCGSGHLKSIVATTLANNNYFGNYFISKITRIHTTLNSFSDVDQRVPPQEVTYCEFSSFDEILDETVKDLISCFKVLQSRRYSN